MSQKKLDKCMCFSKAGNFFVKYFDVLSIFQQLASTAAATSMIAAAVLIVASVTVYFICSFTKLSNVIPILECC